MIIKLTPLEWALMMQESSGRKTATRFEPGFKKRYIDKLKLPKEEAIFRSTSWGLWQIMGDSLRVHGWKGTGPEFMADADRQLAFMRKKWQADIDPGYPLWRHIETWNKGDAGEDRLTAPGDYYRGVSGYLRNAPATGVDGLVEVFMPD